jgi:hypothetical protein
MLDTAVRSQSERRDWMTYHFRLQRTDGTPADPLTPKTWLAALEAGLLARRDQRALRGHRVVTAEHYLYALGDYAKVDYRSTLGQPAL